MRTRHGVLIAALVLVLMAAYGNWSALQAPASAPTQVRRGHPMTVFIGAQYCPYCASMRWPLVEPLNRNGSFTGLRQVSSKDGYEGFGIATYFLPRQLSQRLRRIH
jgi:hypothetical protein